MLLTKLDAWRSGRGGGAIVVGGAGVAIGNNVPNCNYIYIYRELIKTIKCELWVTYNK